MTDFVGNKNDKFALTDQLGNANIRWPGHQVIDGPPQWDYQGGEVLDIPSLFGSHSVGIPVVIPSVNRGGARPRDVREDWFEKIHMIPRRVDAGNILTTVVIVLHMFNAFRYDPHDFEDFTNNAGVGIEITDLPGFPHTLNALDGIDLTLEISEDGPPAIDGTLDFGTDLYDIVIPITGSRLVLFPLVPEVPIIEGLGFLTDILLHIDGTEQRVATRKNPVQTLEYRISADSPDRQFLENMLFDWQQRKFGIPIWFEPTILTSNADADDYTIQVETTDYADYRVGGFAIIFESRFKFDVLEIESLTSNSLTFVSPLQDSYLTSTTQVMPVRNAFVKVNVQSKKFFVNLQDVFIKFVVTDNDSDLGDDSAFNQFDGKVILDGNNYLNGKSLVEAFSHNIHVLDNQTGIITQVGDWEQNKKGSQKGFFVNSRQQLWEVRQLLHFLKGKQISFYLPTFSNDLSVTQQLNNGNTDMVITNIGYTKFARERFSKENIRVHLTDGTSLDRVIEDSAEIDALTEQLTVDTSWPQDIPVDEIERIEYITKVRIDSDKINLVHKNALGTAQIFFPVKEVFD